MFVPYFLFSNVKFNVTVLPFEYQEILAPRIKGYPESHMPTQKDPRQINHPGPFLLLYHLGPTNRNSSEKSQV